MPPGTWSALTSTTPASRCSSIGWCRARCRQGSRRSQADGNRRLAFHPTGVHPGPRRPVLRQRSAYAGTIANAAGSHTSGAFGPIARAPSATPRWPAIIGSILRHWRHDRILDGLREVGLLLIAFSPLETAINRTSLRDAAGFLMLFLGGGLALFAIALVLEWRRQDGL